MHHFMSIGCGQRCAIVMPPCRYHTSSLCPLPKVTFHRAIIIDGLTAHDHAVVVLLDVGAWLPQSTRPCIGLPAIGDEAIVEEVLNQPVAAIRTYTREPYRARCAFKVGCDKRPISGGIEIPVTTEVKSSAS